MHQTNVTTVLLDVEEIMQLLRRGLNTWKRHRRRNKMNEPYDWEQFFKDHATQVEMEIEFNKYDELKLEQIDE